MSKACINALVACTCCMRAARALQSQLVTVSCMSVRMCGARRANARIAVRSSAHGASRDSSEHALAHLFSLFACLLSPLPASRLLFFFASFCIPLFFSYSLAPDEREFWVGFGWVRTSVESFSSL